MKSTSKCKHLIPYIWWYSAFQCLFKFSGTTYRQTKIWFFFVVHFPLRSESWNPGKTEFSYHGKTLAKHHLIVILFLIVRRNSGLNVLLVWLTLFIVVILVSLLLTWDRFHTLFWCFHCWFWTKNKCRLGSKLRR